MDSAARWTQGFEVGKSMDELSAPNSCTIPPAAMEKKVRPAKDQAVNCPRCNSTNTKFCYYNNYSLTQPRYFCKTCRRYWTEGGTLRSVPVGGGSRKNKKSSSTTNSTSVSSSVSSSHKLIPDLNPNSHFHSQNPKILGQGQDLNLGFGGPQNYQHGMIPQFLELPKMESRDVINSSNSNPTSSASLSTLNFLRNGFNSFVPMAPSAMETNALAPGFQFQECKPALGFSVDGMSNGSLLRTNTNLNDEPQENSNGSFVFPFAAMKRQSNASEADQIKGSQENSNGYWNGMLGGGSW